MSFRIFQLIPIALLLIAFSCKTKTKKENVEELPEEAIYYNNEPAEGFNSADSHPIAILLADQVMNAMGGRKKWDNTNVLFWNFFGARTLLWDKENNRVRVDISKNEKVIVLDMNDGTGKVWESGKEILDTERLSKELNKAKNIWINDSYWLVMPFKLKDSGVTLSYLREEETLAGEKCDVLGLTFDGVGVTPQNMYEVWVSIDTRLIKQWAFFKNVEDIEPAFVRPWDDYKDYDGLLLASERGERDITDIKVLKKVPLASFDNSEPIVF